MSEVGVPGTSSEDEKIVTELHIDRFNFLCLDVHRFHLSKDYLYILAFAQHRAHWRSNVGR